MNYIILNGQKSDTIQGLLISSLPSIQKPLVRTEIEEIDGRDGDQVYKLGYSAYDKEMTIGLHGNYDIDEVIGFFDSEGTVIFSNEPDKYYYYQIIEQIDFERLARFRTATVTFHVQPFKFSSVDNKIFKDNNYLKVADYTETKNGITVSMTDGILSVSGNASEPTEIYIPCVCDCKDAQFGLTHNTYTVRARARGSNASKVGIRVCNNAPANPATLGYTILYLSTAEKEQSEELTEDRYFNFLYLYIQPSFNINMTAEIWVNNDSFHSITLRNKGNCVAKPVFKIRGTGNITLKMGGQNVFFITNLNLFEHIVIDTVEMNTYYETEFKNRSVSGEYKDLWFKKGDNTLSWVGAISELEVDEYSRWI